jgi:tRNA dimethylallyltransferase
VSASPSDPIRPRPLLVAILGPTATGKSALGLALAERFGGEIISCDSTAVYRGLNIGTDKVPFAERRGVPHHLVDLVEPTEVFTAAAYVRVAAQVIGEVHDRGHLPILVGGTGFYYRALTRGLFPGPGRDEGLRARLTKIAHRRGVERLHRLLARVDEPSGVRIKPRDLMRIVRALEVYFLTGRTLSQHFADTASPLADWKVAAIGLHPSWLEITSRIARRVDQQFDRGLVEEVRDLLERGVPPDARALTGLGYRQVLQLLRGECDQSGARASIVQQTRRYARRQLIWFRKEPNLQWIHRAGEHDGTIGEADRIVRSRLARDGAFARQQEEPPDAAEC